jgi:hypothetical protein
MFMKTIAVGPFLLVESWVTGGTTVAIDRPTATLDCACTHCAVVARLMSVLNGCLEAIVIDLHLTGPLSKGDCIGVRILEIAVANKAKCRVDDYTMY